MNRLFRKKRTSGNGQGATIDGTTPGVVCRQCGDLVHMEFGWFGAWLHSDGFSVRVERLWLFGGLNLHFAEPVLNEAAEVLMAKETPTDMAPV
jgi:hypothetical protein